MTMVLWCKKQIINLALPPNATLVIKLEDVSRADAPAIAIAEKKMDLNGRQVPILFTLAYDPDKIDPRFRYSVRAQIFWNPQLRWTSTRFIPLLRKITQQNWKFS